MTSTARSERRIAVRGPGVGIDASAASAVPARAPRRSTASSCQVPGTPPQLDAAAVVKARARADDEVTHGAGDEDFASGGLPEDPRGDVYGDPAYVRVEQFTLARMDGGADPDAQCLGLCAQRLGAADGLRRAVERGEVAVAGALDHRAFKPLRELARDFIEAVQYRTPPFVARRGGVLCRCDHVGETRCAGRDVTVAALHGRR